MACRCTSCALENIQEQLTRMETVMSDAVTQLSALRAEFTDYSSDVTAKLDQLAAAQGQFTPEAQTVFDELRAQVAQADATVGDADGSDSATPGEGQQ